jgi:hypothetical protein
MSLGSTHMPRSALAAHHWLWLSLLLIPLALVGAGPVAAQPLSIRSEGGHFSLRVTGIDRPERLNHLHGFEFRLTDAAGKPVNHAMVVLSGRRSDSDSPLPTSPQIMPTAEGGSYRAEGLRFHMPGDWQLIFAIVSGGIRDRAVLNVVVR